MSYKTKAAIVLIALLASPSTSVLLQKAGAESQTTQTPGAAKINNFPSEKEITAQLERSNVLNNHASFSAKFNSEMSALTVSTAMIEGSTPKDYKISALLVARTAMKMCGNKLPRVRVDFKSTHRDQPGFRSVVIRAGDVVAFASKLESPDVLLDSINIVIIDPKVKLSTKIRPTKTAIDDALKQTKGKIADLDRRRVGVKVFQTMYSEVVELEKTRDFRAAAQQLANLNQHLNEQESYIDSLHKAPLRHKRKAPANVPPKH